MKKNDAQLCTDCPNKPDLPDYEERAVSTKYFFVSAIVCIILYTIWFFVHASTNNVDVLSLNSPPRGLTNTPGEIGTAEYEDTRKDWEKAVTELAIQEGGSVSASPPAWHNTTGHENQGNSDNQSDRDKKGQLDNTKGGNENDSNSIEPPTMPDQVDIPSNGDSANLQLASLSGAFPAYHWPGATTSNDANWLTNNGYNNDDSKYLSGLGGTNITDGSTDANRSKGTNGSDGTNDGSGNDGTNGSSASGGSGKNGTGGGNGSNGTNGNDQSGGAGNNGTTGINGANGSNGADDANGSRTNQRKYGDVYEPPSSDRRSGRAENEAPPMSDKEKMERVVIYKDMVLALKNKHMSGGGKDGTSVGHVSVVVNTVNTNTPDVNGGGSSSSGNKESISPGDRFLCKMDLGVNNITPGPVVASCLNGILEGATITGNVTAAEESVILRYDNLSKNKKSVPIEAIAVNTKTGEIGLASEVDRKTLLKNAALFGSYFLKGIGALSLLQGNITTTPTQTVIEKTYNTKDRVAQGLSAVGEGYAKSAKEFFESPAEAKVFADDVFMLVFLKPVLEKDFPG